MYNPQKTPLRIIRGDTIHLDIHISDANGNPWNLTDQEKLVFGVKTTPDSAEYLLKKTVETGMSPLRITLNPEDTAAIAVGVYHYDVGLQSGADYFHVIPTSDFTLCSNVTGWEG